MKGKMTKALLRAMEGKHHDRKKPYSRKLSREEQRAMQAALRDSVEIVAKGKHKD
jgi:hypothetical protein